MSEFIEFFHRIVEPGMLPYTVLLGLVILYWFIVIIGVIDIDILDFGDFGLDGALEGAGEGVGEAIDSIAEGEVSVDSGTEGSSGALHSVLSFLNLGRVPVTVIVSFLSLKMWILAYVYYFYISPRFTLNVPGTIVSLGLFSIIFIFSLFLTGLTTRPFRRLFHHATTHGHQNLLGKICKIKTTEVTGDFGQAELRIDNSFLLLSVRCKDGTTFSKGDEAVITHHDAHKDVYEIKKL